MGSLNTAELAADLTGHEAVPFLLVRDAADALERGGVVNGPGRVQASAFARSETQRAGDAQRCSQE